MNLQPQWWRNLSPDTRFRILGLFATLPAAVFYVILSINEINKWRTKEAPDYEFTSTPGGVPNEEFLKEAQAKLKEFNAVTNVVVGNTTSKELTHVVIVIPRDKGYWAESDNRGTFTALFPFRGRIELSVVSPESSRIVSIFHNKPLEPSEGATVSSAEFGRIKARPVRFEPERTNYYFWGFWITSTSILVFGVWQVVQLFRKSKKTPAAGPGPATG